MMGEFKMWNKNFKRLVITVIIGWILLLACCGLYQCITRDDRAGQEQLYMNKIVDLEQENSILKSCCRWELVLMSILSKQEVVEVDVLEEQLKQKIQDGFNSK